MTQKAARFPTVPEPLPLARFSAADDLRAAVGLWAAWLAGERRASAHTLAAYGRDLAFFFDFLTEHLGELPSLAAIDALRPGDFRAYLARRAGEGIERSSLARGLSVLRGFVRFLQRRGLASTTALAALRSPKLPHAIPKPLTIDDATGSLSAAGEVASNRWQGVRDTAILALLYGCGLRISEALGLKRADIGSRDVDGELIAVPTEWDEEAHGAAPKIRVLVPRRARPGEAAGVGDRVLLRVEETGADDDAIRHSGRVIKVIDRAKHRIIGVYRCLGYGSARLEPVDK